MQFVCVVDNRGISR